VGGVTDGTWIRHVNCSDQTLSFVLQCQAARDAGTVLNALEGGGYPCRAPPPISIPAEDYRDIPLVDDSVTVSQSIQPISDTFKGKRKKLPKKAKAVVPLQNEHILPSASVKETPPSKKKPELINKQKKPVIDVDQIDSPPPSSDVKEALFQFPPGISAEDKLELLLSSPYINEKYDKQHLVAMFMDEERNDYPLLYVDIRRYQVNGWMSNHFVSAYFYLLRKRFHNKNIKFLDPSFWTNYIMEPEMSDTVTQRAWAAKLQKVLNRCNILEWDAIYIPALVNENHFICFYVYGRDREIKVFDPLGLRNDSALEILVNMLRSVYQLSSWNIEHNDNMLWVSRQNDTHSCAFYVCFYAYQHALMGSCQFRYSSAVLKKRIMLSLLQLCISTRTHGFMSIKV
jgi:hypothetical protein